MFLKPQLLATLHPKIKPSKPKLCLKMASWTPQEGPRRAQDSPSWAQDGPKKGRHTTGKSHKIILGALLSHSWGQAWPSRIHLGLFQPRLKSNWRDTCCSSASNGTAHGQAMQTTTTNTPKNQCTNPQAHGVGSAECAERLNGVTQFRWERHMPFTSLHTSRVQAVLRAECTCTHMHMHTQMNVYTYMHAFTHTSTHA